MGKTTDEIIYRLNSNILELQQIALDLQQRSVNQEISHRFGLIQNELSELQDDIDKVLGQDDARLLAKYAPLIQRKDG